MPAGGRQRQQFAFPYAGVVQRHKDGVRSRLVRNGWNEGVEFILRPEQHLIGLFLAHTARPVAGVLLQSVILHRVIENGAQLVIPFLAAWRPLDVDAKFDAGNLLQPEQKAEGGTICGPVYHSGGSGESAGCKPKQGVSDHTDAEQGTEKETAALNPLIPTDKPTYQDAREGSSQFRKNLDYSAYLQAYGKRSPFKEFASAIFALCVCLLRISDKS